MKWWLVGAVCIMAFLLVYRVHLDNPYPLHEDEWKHITESIKLAEGDRSRLLVDLEPGFHIFLAFLYKIGFKLILWYKFLPAAALAVSLLFMFLIVNKMTGFLEGIFSMIFLASIRSNVNLLGFWFFTPLTLAIPLVLLLFYVFFLAIDNRDSKLIWCSIILFCMIFFVHPVSAVLVLPVLLLYARKRMRFFLKDRILLLAGIIGGAFVFLIYIVISWRGDILSTVLFLFSFLYFPKGWGVLEISYNPFLFFGIVSSIFAFVGALVFKQRIFLYWAVFLLVDTFIFRLFLVSVFAPYQRVFYYLMIALVPLSAVGLVWILRQIRLKTILRYTVQSLVVVIVVFFCFFGYYSALSGTDPYQIIDNYEYDALVYLSSFDRTVVIADQWLSAAVYSVSGHDSIATSYFYGTDRNRKDLVEFFSGECKDKLEIIKKYDVGYILSREKIDCSFLEEVYDNGVWVYKKK